MNEIVTIDFPAWAALEQSWIDKGGGIDCEHGLWLLTDQTGTTCFQVFVQHRKPPASKRAKLVMQDMIFEMIIGLSQHPES